MPILTPTGIQFFISDLVNEVVLRTENRVSDTARAAIWLRDALLEITSNPDFRSEFDELEEFGPVFNLNTTDQEYAFSNIVPAGDYNVATLDILLWTDPTANTNRIRLEETSYQDADKISPFPGQPVKWYRFGDSVGFIPKPDKAYQIQARIYKMHPLNDNVVADTQILIGRDWNEILIWAAVERGFIELLEYAKAAGVHTMLYGDPKYPTRPGLINGRKKRREKEAWRMQRALRPVVKPYGWGGYGRR